MSTAKKLISAAGAAAAGETTKYVDDVFSTYLYDGNGTAQTIHNGIALGDGPANGTVLHLTGDSLADSSPSSKTVTNNNSVSVSTSVKKYGTGSLQFDGVDQYLSIASSADFNFGTDDFTIEGWFYAQSDSDERGAIFELYASENDMMRVMINTLDRLEFRLEAGGSNQINITTTTWSENTWHHFAIVNYNGTINCYLDGTSFGSSSSFTMPDFSSAQVLVGLDLFATDRWYTGYIDDLRVTKNRAVYTANFTPPSSAHSLDTQVTGDGGLVWIKGRSTSVSHLLQDTERGATKILYADNTVGEQTGSQSISAFTSDGWNMGNYSLNNQSGVDYTSWTFRKQPGFFDVVTYTPSGSPTNVSHNLGSTPGMIIIKNLTDSSNWAVWHRSLSSVSGGESGSSQSTLKLNLSDAIAGTGYIKSVTSTQFTVSGSAETGTVGKNYVAYVFAHDAQDFGEDEDEAIIKCGYYTGNTSSKPNIDLGFEPQWVMIKCATHSENWIILDSMRGIVTPGSDGVGADARLLADSANAEASSSSTSYIRLHANGFELTGTGGEINAASRDYIYMAIRRPNKPASELTATDMFSPNLGTSTSDWIFNAGFPVDLHFYSQQSQSRFVFDRLRGNKYLTFNSTSDDSTFTCDFDKMTYVDVSGSTINGWTTYNFKRTPGFFDMVTYDGSGSSSTTVNHNLGVVPELIIRKNREAATNWYVWSSALSGSSGNGNFYQSFGENQYYAGDTQFHVVPTATQFTQGVLREAGNDHIAYLFASADGISKIGTYTGNGSTLNVNCGFSNGARFVLVKRSDASGGWYLWDTERGIVSGNDPYFLLNSTSGATNTDMIDPLSSGFQLNANGNGTVNISGATYLFFAIA